MFIGLAGVYAASLDETGSTPKYTNGFQVGAGMAVQINPQYAEGSVYGDNRRVKYKKKFKNANVTLGTTSLPKECQSVMFGRTAGSDGEITSNGLKDEAKYIGLGLYSREEGEDDSKEKFTALWMYKVKFEDPGDDFETEGENITYKTPSLTGSAEMLKNGDWRTKKQFETEDEAIAWIKEKAGVTSVS